MTVAAAVPIRTANPRSAMFCGDSTTVMQELHGRGVRFDTIWADPPYYLSDGGTTCSGGQRVLVDKGDWDKPAARDEQMATTRAWLGAARQLLKRAGTIWVCGTHHNIYQVGVCLEELGYRILNHIVLRKVNPPPNLACRSFVHSHEALLWASLGPDAKYFFDYDAMREENGRKQMGDIWAVRAPRKEEARWGRHPCQKPVALIRRCILASCPPKGLVLDPFAGSGSTGVATLELGGKRKFVGIEQDQDWVDIAVRRLGASRVEREEKA